MEACDRPFHSAQVKTTREDSNKRARHLPKATSEKLRDTLKQKRDTEKTDEASWLSHAPIMAAQAGPPSLSHLPFAVGGDGWLETQFFILDFALSGSFLFFVLLLHHSQNQIGLVPVFLFCRPFPHHPRTALATRPVDRSQTPHFRPIFCKLFSHGWKLSHLHCWCALHTTLTCRNSASCHCWVVLSLWWRSHVKKKHQHKNSLSGSPTLHSSLSLCLSIAFHSGTTSDSLHSRSGASGHKIVFHLLSLNHLFFFFEALLGFLLPSLLSPIILVACFKVSPFSPLASSQSITC